MLVTATGSVQLGYDPLRRLAWTTGNPNFTHFAYDNEALIAEYDYSGNLVRRYVHGPGIDEPLVWYEGTGTSDRRWLHADERGSIVAASNGSGAPIGYNSYDEYGIPASGNIGRFQYTGQQWIAELGMYHYKARMYSQTLGRFLQTDPIGFGGGMNLYAYAGNDPINFTDPSGLCRIWGLVKTTAWPNGKVTRDVLSSWMEGCEREEGGSGEGEGPNGGDGRTDKVEIEVVARPRPRVPEIPNQDLFTRPVPSFSFLQFTPQPQRDYCGSATTPGVPDRPGADIRGACARHDACYSTPGASKSFCDRQFRSDIFYLCLAQGGGGGYCALLSQSYFLGVVWFGQDPYDAAQRAARTRRRN